MISRRSVMDWIKGQTRFAAAVKDLPLTHKPIAQLATKYHSLFVHGRYSAGQPGHPEDLSRLR